MPTPHFLRPRILLLAGLTAAATVCAGMAPPALAQRSGDQAAKTGNTAKPGKKGKSAAPGKTGPSKGGPGKSNPGKSKSKKGPKGPPRRARRAMAVGVDKVIKAPLQETVPIIGRIISREGGVISARTPGPVEEIRVHVGDRVKKGQILALLVTARLRERVSLQIAELQLAQQELTRLERLRTNKSAAFPKARYDDAVQKVAKARVNLRIVRLELSYAHIRAPYPGVITKRHTEAGAYLRQGDNVVSMINDRNLELEADVPTSRVVGLTPGRKVRFELANGQFFPATVRAVVPEQNSLTRTVAVRFTPTWDPAKVTLAINQNVNLHIPVGSAKVAVSVHKDAVISRGPVKMVFVVVKKPRGPMVAVPRIVRLGEAVGSRFIVLGGVKPGDIVIVRGNERVRPGMPVRPLRRR